MTEDTRLEPPALAGSELFTGLAPAALEEALAAGSVRRVPDGMLIFRQGDGGVRAHVLVAGAVRIMQTGSDGGEVIVRLIGPGGTFGTVALFTDRRYPADAVALTDSIEVSWSEDSLLALLARYPQLAINVIKVVGKRLQEVQERVRELATQRVEQRVARAVLRLAGQAGHRTIAGTAIEFPLRRKDVADIAGTTLHTVSRLLTAWQRTGLLISHNRRLTLRAPAEIFRIAEDGGG